MKKRTLKEIQKEISFSFKKARNTWFFKRQRKLKDIAECFGLKIYDEEIGEKVLSYPEVERYRDFLLQLATEKFKLLLPEKFEEVKKEEKTIEFEILLPEVSDSVFKDWFPDQKVKLLTQKDGCEQVKTAKIIFDRLWYERKRGQLLIAQAGAGKTYIIASVLKNLITNNYLKDAWFSPWPIIWVTKASVVEQTRDVLKNEFGLDTVNTIHVINIELLRSELGSLFVSEDLEIINGEEHVIYKWKKIFPVLIIWDECQILAREYSIQSKIAQDFNRIEERYKKEVHQIFMSATPFSRVCEAICFACSTQLEFPLGTGLTKLSLKTWRTFASLIAAPRDPYEYSEAAIKRLMERLEPNIVRIKNIRPKHRAYNGTLKIYFQSQEERKEYDEAWEEYQEQKAKIEGDESLSASQSRFAILAQFTIFRKKAEKIKAPHFAKFAVDSWAAGKAPILACCFKGTIVRTYKILVAEYGYTRDDVSIIWGGATETISAKKKLAKRIKESEALRNAFAQVKLDINEILGFDVDSLEEKTEEELIFEKVHRLNSQKPEEREKERVRFQKQKTKLMIFTFKSGGVGLSCHHQYPEARQRETWLTPVYSEKELVQGLGRGPRITSLSDTYQYIVYYPETIEAHVAERVKIKLKNLKHVVKFKESWESIITGKKLLDEELGKEVEDETEGGNEMMEYKEEE